MKSIWEGEGECLKVPILEACKGFLNLIIRSFFGLFREHEGIFVVLTIRYADAKLLNLQNKYLLYHLIWAQNDCLKPV